MLLDIDRASNYFETLVNCNCYCLSQFVPPVHHHCDHQTARDVDDFGCFTDFLTFLFIGLSQFNLHA